LRAFTIALLALAASATSFTNRFAIDDLAIIAHDSRIQRLAAPWRFFTQTYWPTPTRGTLFRPLTSLAFAVEWRLGDGAPWPYHLVNVLLYLCVCVAVYRLAVGLLGPLAGWWAAALFAVHPVHVEAVGNSVGQAELWAALGVVLAVNRYIAVRRTRGVAARDIVLLAVLYLAACLFKEHAIMLPGLLLAAELFLLGGRPADLVWKRELRGLGLALAITAVAFWGMHALVVGDLAGDRANLTFVGMTYHDRVLTMLGVVPEWMRLLFVPIHLQVDYMPQEVQQASTFGLPQLLGTFILLGAVGGAVRARRRQPVVTFAVCWAGLTLFPVSNVLVPSGVTIAERTQFLPSVGATLVLGTWIAWLATRSVGWPATQRRMALGIGAVVVAAATARSALRQPVWRNSNTILDQMLVDSPRSYRAHWWQARRFYKARDHAGAEREFRLAVELFPRDAALLADLADHYGVWNRCDEAVALYRRSLAIAPERAWLHGRLVRCLARLGRLQEAREEGSKGAARGHVGTADALRYVDSLAGVSPADPDETP
jgi:hypothetical protein